MHASHSSLRNPQQCASNPHITTHKVFHAVFSNPQHNYMAANTSVFPHTHFKMSLVSTDTFTLHRTQTPCTDQRISNCVSWVLTLSHLVLSHQLSHTYITTATLDCWGCSRQGRFAATASSCMGGEDVKGIFSFSSQPLPVTQIWGEWKVDAASWCTCVTCLQSA